MTTILEAKNVYLNYGNKEALHGVNLSFEKNKITALIGPSGCGKSTFLRCLNRMNDLRDKTTVNGSFKLLGQDIYSNNIDLIELRKQIGIVFQQPNPFPFSVYENVAYGLKIAGIKDKNTLDEKVESSLKQAAIWDELKDKLHINALNLSGGQQQRICIARVLAVEPKIILMDEPTSALDPISSAKIEDTLLELKQKITIIMVTHNIQQAARIADKIAFMLNGRLIEYNDTQKMFLNPEKSATNDYLNGQFG